MSNYYAHGVKIRIIDIGGSYKKLAAVHGGVYIDIADKNINLNPFQTVKNLNKKYNTHSENEYDEKDKTHDIETIVMCLCEMIYSSQDEDDSKLTSGEVNLLTHAVKHVIADGVVENSIDAV